MASDAPVRVRIAPSPTGNLHVGTARVAVFNELFAKQNNGQFIIRIEDTDKARSKPEYEGNILEGLQWLGIEWNEGPDVGGPCGPYRQSERVDVYQQALEKLLEEGKAYYCYCPPVEPGQEKPACVCHVSGEDIKEKGDAQETTVIRLQVEPQTVTFTDIVRGEVSIHSDDFGGNFAIARSLTDPLFHLAVVVDDAAMNITHVIRGEDHLHNTAKHILIQRALGYEQPVYAHLPLLLDEERRKLSKRSGETSLLAYRDMGYLPEAMLNYLALLGWSPKDDSEFFTHDDLIQKFNLEGVQKSGAIFSLIKLQSVNKEHLRKLTPEELLERARPFLEQAGMSVADEDLLKKALKTEQERVSTLAELPEAIRFFLPDWRPDYEANVLVWRKSTAERTHELLQMLHEKLDTVPEEDFIEEKLQEILIEWIDTNNLGRGDMLWPMRVALTGREHSPGPFEVASILKKQQTLLRVQKALDKLQ